MHNKCLQELVSRSQPKVNTTLGAVIGSAEYKDEYVTSKIQGWVDELKELQKVAKVEPHISYCA